MPDLQEELTESLEETSAPATETTPEAPPVGEEPVVSTAEATEVPPSEGEKDYIGVDPEVLEKLKSSPEGFALYKSLNQKATKKFQEIAAQKKFWDAFQNDPKGVVAALAQRVGISVGENPTKNEEKKIETVVDSFSKRFGPEVGGALRDAAEEFFSESMAPLYQEQTDAKIVSATESFYTRHKDVVPKGELDLKIQGLINKFPPKDVESLPDYLEMIYGSAISGKSKTEVTKEVSERMRKSADSVEPVRGVTKSGQKQYREGMKLDEIFEDIAE